MKMILTISLWLCYPGGTFVPQGTVKAYIEQFCMMFYRSFI